MGDFNTPLKENEKLGESQPNLDSRTYLMDFIDGHALHDIYLQGINYTWTNRRSGKDLIQVRLDRDLASNEWFHSYYCSLTDFVRAGLDHYLITLMVEPVCMKRNFPFHFEKMWTIHPNLENLIEEWWKIRIEGTTMFKIATQKC